MKDNQRKVASDFSLAKFGQAPAMLASCVRKNLLVAGCSLGAIDA